MRYIIDHDYHIHSRLSTCSSCAEQSPERILQYAKEYGLKKICITDHYWDSTVEGASEWYKPQNYEHIAKSLPLPQCDGVEFLFGCETELDKNLTLGIPESRYDDFSFIIIPTTHLHMEGFTIDMADTDSHKRRAELWIERLDGVLSKDLPFHKIGIAHLVCALFDKRSRADLTKTLDLIPTEEMERVFAKAAKVGCGIELNCSDMKHFTDDETESILRPFRVAKRMGCKFYLGSDAHRPTIFTDPTVIAFNRAIDLLDLTEDDKFHIGN
jgi:histidinol phosphatase-like PHP family hydrolase